MEVHAIMIKELLAINQTDIFVHSKTDQSLIRLMELIASLKIIIHAIKIKELSAMPKTNMNVRSAMIHKNVLQAMVWTVIIITKASATHLMDTTVFKINNQIWAGRDPIAGLIMDWHVQITLNTNLNAGV